MPSCIAGCSKSGGDRTAEPRPNPSKLDFSFDITADTNLTSRGWTTRNNVIIVSSGSTYLAYEEVCPHQFFLLTYDPIAQIFPCANTGPNHGSIFDINGKRITGPAARDLKKYQVQLNGKMLRVYEE